MEANHGPHLKVRHIAEEDDQIEIGCVLLNKILSMNVMPVTRCV